MKILIAEDDLVSRRTLEILLTRWGYEVVVAGDGTTAWDILQRPESPRLAILDWMMPGMDGLEICNRFKQSEQTPAPYLILLSAKSSKQDVIEGLEGGADDYLTKPVDLQELRARLHVGQRTLDRFAKLVDQIRNSGEQRNGKH